MSVQYSRSLSVVINDCFHNPLLRFEYFSNRRSLAVAKLEHDFAARLQKWRGFGGDATIKGESVGTAIECLPRIMIANFDLQ